MKRVSLIIQCSMALRSKEKKRGTLETFGHCLPESLGSGAKGVYA